MFFKPKVITACHIIHEHILCQYSFFQECEHGITAGEAVHLGIVWSGYIKKSVPLTGIRQMFHLPDLFILTTRTVFVTKVIYRESGYYNQGNYLYHNICNICRKVYRPTLPYCKDINNYCNNYRCGNPCKSACERIVPILSIEKERHRQCCKPKQVGRIVKKSRHDNHCTQHNQHGI